MPLAAADRDKLVRILGMLGSDHAGERDAAALAAHRLISGRGMSWADVLGTVRPLPMPRPSPPVRRDPFQVQAMECLDHPELFNAWEQAFLRGAIIWRRLSPKRAATLDTLVARLKRAGHYPG